MGIRFAVLSTYPSTPCGIATFTEALTTHLELQGATTGVVRMVDTCEEMSSPVVAQWLSGRPEAAAEIAAVMNTFDVAVIQHEYGIFGGPDGEDVLALVALLRVPIITVLHTVLTDPIPNQHRVLAELCAASTSLVTMTETARTRLVAGWGIDPALVTVIAHGAVDNRFAPDSRESAEVMSLPGLRPALSERPSILTWGLLSQGKGIEWALLALAQLQDITPTPLYSIVGRTHPRVVEREGEQYRDRLVGMVEALALAEAVDFNAQYLSGPALRAIVRAADIIVLPYDSRDQVTSGVLTEAVAAGKPVISTAFPHAVELLSSGAGLLVPQGDADALADALRRVLTEPGLADQMAATSFQLATSLLWPAVAQSYIDMGTSLVEQSLKSVA